MTRCEDFAELVELFLDGELDDPESAEMEAHLSACSTCCEELEARASLKDQLGALAFEHTLDDGFLENLSHSISVSGREEVRRPPRTWMLAAAAVALVSGTAAVTYAVTATPAAEPAEMVVIAPEIPPVSAVEVAESVRWHSRPVPVEVTGPNPAAVGDWFRGKVDFHVQPPNFARRAHLLGGRLGNVSEHEAAVLVYDVSGTKLSVVMYEPENDIAHGAPTNELPFYVGERNGYNVAFHEVDGVAYTFTTNLPDTELRELVNVAFSY